MPFWGILPSKPKSILEDKIDEKRQFRGSFRAGTIISAQNQTVREFLAPFVLGPWHIIQSFNQLMRNSLATVLALALCLTRIVPTFQQAALPGIYIDWIQIFDYDSEYNRYQGTYNFNKNWRQQLPGAEKCGLSLANFRAPVFTHLNYTIEASCTVTGADVALNVLGGLGGLNHLAFSVLVITQDNQFIDFATLTMPRSTTIGSNPLTLVADAKDDLSLDKIVILHQWMSFFFTYNSLSYDLQLTVEESTPNSGNYQYKATYSNTLQLISGFKIHVLRHGLNINGNPIKYGAAHLQLGQASTVEVYGMTSYEPLTSFGHPLTGGKCLFGFQNYRHIHRESSFATKYLRFEINEGQNTIIHTSGVLQNSDYAFYCFEPSYLCPNGNLPVNGLCGCSQGQYEDLNGGCSPCPNGCQSCTSNTQCDSCIQNHFFYQNPADGSKLCYSQCPSGSYLSTSSNSCQSCLYDCLTCSNGQTCDSCDSVNHHRRLNSATSRCVPLDGYYESGVTVAGACMEGCQECTEAAVCIRCDHPNYFQKKGICSSKNKSNNGNGNQKVKSSLCPENCLSCSSSSSCSQCQSGYQLAASGSRCEAVGGSSSSILAGLIVVSVIAAVSILINGVGIFKYRNVKARLEEEEDRGSVRTSEAMIKPDVDEKIKDSHSSEE